MKLSMLEFIASCSETLVSVALIPALSSHHAADAINVNKNRLASRALTGKYQQCLTFIKQSTTLQGSHSA